MNQLYNTPKIYLLNNNKNVGDKMSNSEKVGEFMKTFVKK